MNKIDLLIKIQKQRLLLLISGKVFLYTIFLSIQKQRLLLLILI